MATKKNSTRSITANAHNLPPGIERFPGGFSGQGIAFCVQEGVGGGESGVADKGNFLHRNILCGAVGHFQVQTGAGGVVDEEGVPFLPLENCNVRPPLQGGVGFYKGVPIIPLGGELYGEVAMALVGAAGDEPEQKASLRLGTSGNHQRGGLCFGKGDLLTCLLNQSFRSGVGLATSCKKQTDDKTKHTKCFLHGVGTSLKQTICLCNFLRIASVNHTTRIKTLCEQVCVQVSIVDALIISTYHTVCSDCDVVVLFP